MRLFNDSRIGAKDLKKLQFKKQGEVDVRSAGQTSVWPWQTENHEVMPACEPEPVRQGELKGGLQGGLKGEG